MSARDVTNQLIQIGEAGGPDLLYRLQGHTPSYTSWAYDVFDADPMNVQVRVPRRTPHRRPAARALPRCLARAARVGHCAPAPLCANAYETLIVPCALSPRGDPFISSRTLPAVNTHARRLGGRRLRLERRPCGSDRNQRSNFSKVLYFTTVLYYCTLLAKTVWMIAISGPTSQKSNP
jgi:hypothetical protein